MKDLQQVYYRVSGFLKRQSPTILVSVGVVGVVATSVATAKGAIKAKTLLEDAKEKKGEPLTKKETFKVAAPAYIPAVLLGTATASCIIGSHVIHKRKEAALASAYTVLNQSYNEYKDKVKDMYGEEVSTNIKESVAKDKYREEKENKTLEEKPHGTDVLLFFDEHSNRYFWKTMQEVKDAEYHLNRNFSLRGYASLNEFYSFLGLGPTPYGDEVGWSIGVGEAYYGYNWIDFYHKFHKNDNPSEPDYYTIEMPFAPTTDFMDY